MKKNLTYILVACCLLTVLTVFSSCSLDEVLIDTVVVDDIKTEADLNTLMKGAYSQLNTNPGFKRQGFYMVALTADDLNSQTGILAPFGEKSYTSANTGNFWGVLYRTVGHANNALEIINGMDTAVLSDAAKNRYRGEAYFLRAFSYYYLVRMFGEVPLRLDAVTKNSEFYLPRTSVDSIYRQIFADFELASRYCPRVNQLASTDIGRATKGAAQALLASANLTFANWMENNNKSTAGPNGDFQAEYFYQKAVNWCDSVIMSGNYSLFDDYGYLWNVSNEANLHKEVIFSIQFVVDPTRMGAASAGSEFPNRFNPNNYLDGTLMGSNNIVVSASFLYDYFTDRNYFLQSNKNVGRYPDPDTLDYRIEKSFYTYWQNARTGLEFFACPFVNPNIPSPNIKIQSNIKKYIDPSSKDINTSGNDYNIIRFAEMLLIKAEALNELNRLPEAIDALNVVRKRARRAGTTNDNNRPVPALLSTTTVSSKGQMRGIIFKERGLELAGEGQRWFDLVRMKSVDGTETMFDFRFRQLADQNQYSRSQPSYDNANYRWNNANYVNWECIRRVSDYQLKPNRYRLFPIPSSEIENNPSMGQNPGW